MKKLLSILFLILFLFPCLAGCSEKEDPNYLRIHIRANSDSPDDQEIKLVVRDSVVEYLSPLLQSAKTRQEAEKIVLSHVDKLEKQIDELLFSCGYFYTCSVRIDTEFFEEKTYGDLTLEKGYYRAVIVALGTGEGKNWWCVAFPPLCFALGEDYQNIQYKSIVYEVVKKYLREEK